LDGGKLPLRSHFVGSDGIKPPKPWAPVKNAKKNESTRKTKKDVGSVFIPQKRVVKSQTCIPLYVRMISAFSEQFPTNRDFEIRVSFEEFLAHQRRNNDQM